MSSKKVLIDLHYLPCIDYLTGLLEYNSVIFEANENFQKQTYRNRCYIITSTKKLTLVIPVRHTNQKIKIKDVEIDYSQNWTQSHWRSIQTSYSKSPFFEYLEEEFHEVMFKKEKFLYDLNLKLIHLIFKILNFDPDIQETTHYERYLDTKTSDLRNKFDTRKYKITKSQFQYSQVFGKEFVPNLSIIDLLFSEGKNAGYKLLQNAINTKRNNE